MPFLGSMGKNWFGSVVVLRWVYETIEFGGGGGHATGNFLVGVFIDKMSPNHHGLPGGALAVKDTFKLAGDLSRNLPVNIAC